MIVQSCMLPSSHLQGLGLGVLISAAVALNHGSALFPGGGASESNYYYNYIINYDNTISYNTVTRCLTTALFSLW